MATQKIAMGINLRQNKIEGSTAYGKYYPEVDTQKTLSLRGFAQHMTDHGSLYGRAIVEGVLLQITECLPELVAQGVPVQLGSLGTFYLDEARQPLRSEVQGCLHAGAAQHHQHSEGDGER